MLLITEHIETVNYITEDAENGQKNHFIEGIFMQAEQKNKNGRMYPKKVLMGEVKRYNKDFW